jgi:thymidylate kinase
MIYYLTGPDGSGKTTLLELVKNKLSSEGYTPIHTWIRSPKIFSKPLMVYCRLFGLTKYEWIDGIRYGKHEFYRSRIVSWLFPILQLIDFKLKYFLTRPKIGSYEKILMDRFSLDTLADLMVDTHRYNLHKTKIGSYFINLVPKDTKILLLQVDEINIRKRKLDTLHDPNLSIKIEVYSILAEDLNLQSINNNNPINHVFNQILLEFDL